MARQVFLHQIPVRYVKGVGPGRAEQLKRLEIESVEDLLLAVPRRYEDRRNLLAISELVPGQMATLRARVLEKRFRPIRGGRPLVEAAVGDDTGVASCCWFNQPYLNKLLTVGDELIVYGKVEVERRRLQLINPEIERVEDDAGSSLHAARIVPIHGLTAGVSQRWLRKTEKLAVDRYAPQAVEPLPEPFRRRLALPPIGWAYAQVHFPDDWDALAKAQRRLAFDELFLMQVRMALRRARLTAREKPQRYWLDGPVTSAFRDRLPFALTASQQAVLRELLDDLAGTTPMLRLLQGDVGCGKTVVAAWLMAVAAQSGFQVAFMAPTELLAQQHARVLARDLEPLGIRVALLAQGLAAAPRRQLLKAIAEGDAQVVIGTHAILEEAVAFKALSLVVIDEQHKFGVSQRVQLVKKAQTPDVLVMSATPIPRTMALSIYGDLACSTITALPPGRQPIETRWHPNAERGIVYGRIRKHLAAGRQGYVVYPIIETSEKADLKAATAMAKELGAQFPQFRVALLHGRLKSAEQEQTMRAFAAGDVQLLVSTVIVEVGLDVPNATVMLIEHPERFGLAQLHQLRGRIGRGRHPALCLLLSDAEDETARKRLTAFTGTTDGFQLAEEDLALRGPGELLGSRQHGWLRFRVANLVKDGQLLELARREAFALVARDPQLRDPLWSMLRARFQAAKPAAPAPKVLPVAPAPKAPPTR